MNSLSWFLYFADVVNGIGTIFIFVAIGCALAISIKAIYTATLHDSHQGSRNIPIEEYEEDWAKWFKFTKKTIVFGMLAVIISILIPSKQTLYLIAGSQIGEKVVNDGTNQEILTLVQKKIKSYLTDVVPEKK